jgi:cation diffusion facilitator family transporter
MIDYKQGRNITVIGAVVNLALMALKLWGGFISRSQALIADGIHSLSDLAGDMVVLLGIRWGREDEDDRHPFGHGRIETLASLIVGLMLFLAGGGMFFMAVKALLTWDLSNPTPMAILVAVVSIIAKEILYQYTKRVGQRIDSPALISNAWHHRSDALSSVAVVIGVAAGAINPDWRFLDSVAAIVVAGLIMKVGGEFVLEGIRELVDTAPDAEVIKRIEVCAGAVEGVHGVHDLKARTSGGKVFAEIHIIVDGAIPVRDGHDVAKAVENCLIDEIPRLSKAIVHVDPT